MNKTEDHYERVLLETVYGYSSDELDRMSDQDCEDEYDVIFSKMTDTIADIFNPQK